MAQVFLEGFQWHGVKRGDAFAFYAGDIRVVGPRPFSSSGGNLGTGRLRTAMIPTASSSSAARPARVRSRFGQKRRWRNSSRPAVAAGSCSASNRADGPLRWSPTGSRLCLKTARGDTDCRLLPLVGLRRRPGPDLKSICRKGPRLLADSCKVPRAGMFLNTARKCSYRGISCALCIKGVLTS